MGKQEKRRLRKKEYKDLRMQKYLKKMEAHEEQDPANTSGPAVPSTYLLDTPGGTAVLTAMIPFPLQTIEKYQDSRRRTPRRPVSNALATVAEALSFSNSTYGNLEKVGRLTGTTFNPQLNTRTLHRFKELPIELRQMVWSHALPGPQVITIYADGYIEEATVGNRTSHKYIPRPKAKYRIPILLHANQDSRAFFLTKKQYNKAFGNLLNGNGVWFNFGTDLLHFQNKDAMSDFYHNLHPLLGIDNTYGSEEIKHFEEGITELHEKLQLVAFGDGKTPFFDWVDFFMKDFKNLRQAVRYKYANYAGDVLSTGTLHSISLPEKNLNQMIQEFKKGKPLDEFIKGFFVSIGYSITIP